jgi:serine/threonine protein kinase
MLVAGNNRRVNPGENYDKFFGSLEHLKDLSKLRHVGVANSNVNSGLEYLPFGVAKFWCGSYGGINPLMSGDKLAEILKYYKLDETGEEGYDYQSWRKDKQEWEEKGFGDQEFFQWIKIGLKANESVFVAYLKQKGYNSTHTDIFIDGLREEYQELLAKEQIKNSHRIIEDVTNQIKRFNFSNLTSEQQLLINKLIPEGELKERCKKYGLCSGCHQPNTGSNWCQSCNAQHFQEFNNWTSGNQEIDQFIQKCQKEAIDFRQLLEWIPYDKFTDVEYLAKGGFGTISKAKWNDGYIKNWGTGDNKWARYGAGDVVLKSLNDSQNITAEFLREITYNKLVDNSSQLVRCFGISQDPETKNYLMVMDYMKDGNLREYLQKEHLQNNHIEFKVKLHQLCCIAKGLVTIHEQGLMHQDFHSGNILKKGKHWCYITDLGLCRPANEKKDGKEIFGVLPYVAPEVLRGQSYTQSSDIYSFGMIIYEVVFGLPPYYDILHDELLAVRICKGLRPNFQIKIPKLLEDLIKRCWDNDLSKRYTIYELENILSDWHNEVSLNKSTEFVQQVEEVEKLNKNLLSDVKCTGYKLHPGATLTSKSINVKLITELYSDSLQFDFTKLDLEDNAEETITQVEIPPKGNK